MGWRKTIFFLRPGWRYVWEKRPRNADNLLSYVSRFSGEGRIARKAPFNQSPTPQIRDISRIDLSEINAKTDNHRAGPSDATSFITVFHSFYRYIQYIYNV